MTYSMLWRTTFVGLVALLFAACSSGAGTSRASKPAQAIAAAGQALVQTQTAASATPAASQGSVDAALQAVVTRANAEQAQALSQQNPRVMQDTATSSYYHELVQTNNDLVASGVTAIKLANLAWGPVSVNGAQAQLTTSETWRTTYVDGSADQATDRNVYTLVKQSGAWKIQADVHPDSGLNQPVPGSQNAPGPSSQPAPSSGAAPTGTGAAPSQNWAGYAADSGTFTAVSGTWTIPQAQADSSQGADATWVGIGGVNSRDLIQTGTETTVLGGGSLRYQAWVETLPQASQTVPLTVSPGDSVTASIVQQSAGQWLVTLKDNTTGQSYHVTEQYNSSLSSADWIEEAPSGARSVAPLDNFGTVSFSNATAVKDGKTLSLAQAGAQPITMANAFGQALATPSPLNSDGKSFSVSRTAATATSGFGGQPVGVSRSRSGGRPGFAP